jgi:hypothetical protein
MYERVSGVIMLFNEFIKKVKVNGFDVPVKVQILVTEEDDGFDVDADIDFGDVKAEQEYIERFRKGELFRAVISVHAEAFGIEGFDVLGACHIHSNNLFNSEPFNKDVDDVITTHDMVNNAVNDCVNNLKKKAKELNSFA